MVEVVVTEGPIHPVLFTLHTHRHKQARLLSQALGFIARFIAETLDVLDCCRSHCRSSSLYISLSPIPSVHLEPVSKVAFSFRIQLTSLSKRSYQRTSINQSINNTSTLPTRPTTTFFFLIPPKKKKDDFTLGGTNAPRELEATDWKET